MDILKPDSIKALLSGVGPNGLLLRQYTNYYLDKYTNLPLLSVDLLHPSEWTTTKLWVINNHGKIVETLMKELGEEVIYK